ncbi:DUF2231 domain-containing protein [Streptomonospora salina]|uniref:Putative membrane protein n=1 Tax=Streptomonospora salina TaxID=104205 RepID=A0A841EIW0_9ACTN|nr:DUF2231 domain-containing protein [Streptomonospora salina]MBB6000748.1 putative membrane protein [Streptomonospora salina]
MVLHANPRAARRRSRVPTVVLRAAVILGSGSASFEMLRHLTERLPVMTTPRRVSTRVQPIAVRDVLRLLVAALRLPAETDRTFDIGGPDVLTCARMVQRFARLARLRPRLIVPVPVLTPGLSSLWVGLVTPVPGAVARPLIESLRNEATCGENDLAGLLGDDDRLGYDQAVELALSRVREAEVDTRWSSAAWACERRRGAGASGRPAAAPAVVAGAPGRAEPSRDAVRPTAGTVLPHCGRHRADPVSPAMTPHLRATPVRRVGAGQRQCRPRRHPHRRRERARAAAPSPVSAVGPAGRGASAREEYSMTHEPTPSRAAVKGHPVHPMLVALPIGLIVAALAADIGYVAEGSPAWASAGVWLVGGGLFSGLAAAVPGLVDFIGVRKIRKSAAALRHGAANGVVLVLLLVTFLLRIPDPEGAVLPTGLMLTALSTAILGYAGWLGGELSFRRMFGVDPS